MKQKQLILISLLLYSLGLRNLQAQQAILTTGGEASGSGGSACYSVGQVVYTANTGTNSSIAQGVQQPYEILIVTGIEQAKSIRLRCKAYPNPTTDFLTLKVENFNTDNLSYQLFDINGKLLKSNNLTGIETEIDIQNLKPANYFLKVISKEKGIKTFKIIKNY